MPLISLETRGDGHYYQFNPTYKTVEVKLLERPKLPTKDIVVNMDGGVGGSWKEVSEEEFDEIFVEFNDKKKQTKQLPEDCQEPFYPKFSMTKVDTEKICRVC